MNIKKIIFIFLLSTQSVWGQQPACFILGEAQFEGVQIYDVIQDNDLNYWFATDQGFFKYDSYSFKKIDCSGMKGFSAFGFVINQDGAIFCYNLNNQILKIENSICSVFYELKGDERSNDIYLTISPENYLIVVTKTALVFDKSAKRMNVQKPHSNYYGFPFLTKQGRTICHIFGKDSLLIFDGNKLRVTSLSVKAIPIEGVLKFFRIDTTVYAISTKDKTIYVFDEGNYQLSALPEKPALQTKEFLRFYNENNQLWIAGTVSGVRTLSGPDNQNLSGIMYSQFLISDVFKDHEGNILLSTFNNGVLVIPNLEIPDVLTLPEKQSIVSIHYDNDLGLIMGSLKGQLLSYKDNQYKTLSDNGTKPIQAIYSWPNFPYIIYDDGQIKACNKKTGKFFLLLEASLKGALLTGDNNIYLALNRGVCKIRIDNFNSFEMEYIDSLKMRSYSIAIDAPTKNIFVATSDGLKMLKPDGSVGNIILQEDQIFANDLIGNNRTLYASTKRNGLLLFETGKAVRKIIPMVNQKEIEIYKLIEKDKVIYTNSSQGFVVLDRKGLMLTQLNKAHGFSTNKIFDFEIFENQLWISHSKGVQKININQLNNKKTKPLVKISNLYINDAPATNLTKEGLFDNSQRKFRFVISSPTLKNKENINYHYKLVGYENNWLEADYDDNEITYNALAPGAYTFLVKAENQGIFSDMATYSFTIAAPFYFRWWFIASCLFLFFVTVIIIYRWQLNIQRRKSEQINELNASKLIAIQSQMNPHFIFNSLNSIQDLVLKGDVEHSYTYITTFSNMVRRTLNYSEKDFIDIEQEIKLLELYLSLEKLRFKKDLNYKINIENINDIMIPPLLIQPFIENALVHGLLHKEGAKELLINFRMEEMLVCTIEDNGIGREKAKMIRQRQRAEHESFSGKAIQRRFEILSNLFKGKFGYTYEDLFLGEEPVGTRVTLKIPVKQKF